MLPTFATRTFASIASFAWLSLLPLKQETPAPAVLDPQLQSAIDELQESTGYRFDATGSALLPFDPITPLAHPVQALAPLAELADFLLGTEIHGRFERGDPLLLATGPIQAFRADGNTVFRRRIRGKWSPWTAVNEVVDPERDELHRLRLVARLPAPEELLENLGSRTATWRRTDDPKREELATFECQILPDAGWTLQSDRPIPLPTKLSTCTLRVTVDHGSVAQVELESVATIDDSTTFATRVSAGEPAANRVVIRYRISEAGKTKVNVPEEAAQLLGSR